MIELTHLVSEIRLGEACDKCYKGFLGICRVWQKLFQRRLITLTPVVNVMNFFSIKSCHYGHNLRQNHIKYDIRSIQHAVKSFLTLTPIDNVIKLFFNIIAPLSA